MDAENNIEKHIVWDCHYSHFWLGGCPAGTAPTQAPCEETPTLMDQSLGWDKENIDVIFFSPKNPSKSRQNLPHFSLPGWPSCPRPLKSGNIHQRERIMGRMFTESLYKALGCRLRCQAVDHHPTQGVDTKLKLGWGINDNLISER